LSTILEARHVAFAYAPHRWAIRDLDFVISEPRRICVLGANGVGKSTLMLLINGTHQPQEGEIIVLGEPIDYSKAGLHRLRRQIAIVLQDPDDQLFGATVEQDVAFGPLNNGLSSDEARAEVRATLERLGIAHLADRPIHELSLGEKRRVALAGVLVLRPQIVLLDEPTAGLDFDGITAMLGLLNDLHKGGTTLVISTHDTELAYGWADEAWVLGDGRITAQGPTSQVLHDRATLQRAHLQVPLLVEIGQALHEADPELAGRPLPQSRDALTDLVRRACRRRVPVKTP
jgi:cobalt/nickel transport system ATP-binding protein